MDDIEFFSNEKIRSSIDQVLQFDSTSPLAGRDSLRYRTQRNSQNSVNSVITWKISVTVPCHVPRVNIVKRFARLDGFVGIERRVPLCV